MNENKESLMRRFGVNDTAVSLKSVARDEIANQVDAFLASGGVIQKAGTGQGTAFDPATVYRNYPAMDALNSNDHSLPFAAKFLGIPERKLQRMMLAGKGPAHIVAERGEKNFYRFRMVDLVEFKKQIEAAL